MLTGRDGMKETFDLSPMSLDFISKPFDAKNSAPRAPALASAPR